MLATAQQVDAACRLSINDVRAAMERGGYKIERGEITGVDFKGMNCQGTFVYAVAGPDPEGGDDITLGNVYLKFRRNAFSTTVELYGEY